MTVVTVAAATAAITTVEVQEVSAAAVITAQRARPIVAATASVADICAIAIARSGKENAIAVRASYLVTVYTVKGRPGPCAVIA